MDLEKLNEYVIKSGYRKQYIADQLKLSYQGLAYKLKGKHDFTISEVNAISRVLNLKEKEKVSIFFNDDSELNSPNGSVG